MWLFVADEFKASTTTQRAQNDRAAEIRHACNGTDCMRAGTRHLNALTGLRFLAAFYVVIFHFGKYHLSGGPTWLTNIARSGFISVGLFFVLSGFVLTYTYVGAAPVARIDKRKFWVARLARIYPVYFASLLLALPYTFTWFERNNSLIGAVGKLGAAFAIDLTLLQGWAPQTAMVINYPSWSISVESLFYLVFPFLGLFILRLGRHRLIVTGLVVWVASLLAALAYLVFDPSAVALTNPDAAGQRFWLQVLMYSPLSRVPDFMIGMVVGRLFLDFLKRPPDPWTKRVGTLASSAGLVGLFVLLSHADQLPLPLLNDALLTPFFALTIFGLATGGGVVAWLLERPFMVMLGEVSYGVYILQAPVWEWTQALGRLALQPEDYEFGYHSPAFFMVYCIVLIGMSISSYYLFERPMRGVIRRALTPAVHRTTSSVPAWIAGTAP